METSLFRRIVAGFIVILLLGWALNQYIFAPRLKRIAALKSDITVLRKSIPAKETEVEALRMAQKPTERPIPEILKEIAIVAKRSEELARRVPSAKEVPSIIDQVLSAGAKGINIEYTLVQPGTPVPEGAFNRIPLAINFTGTYSDFMAYLTQIQGLNLAIRFDSINIEKSRVLPDRLEININFSIFVMPGGGPVRVAAATAEVVTANLRDPFLAAGIAAEKAGGLTGEALFTLKGIWRGKENRAFINDEIVAQGGTINDYKVISIQANKVILVRGGQRLVLTTKGE
jgi:Tfp pilus assembly protein PilO